MQIRNFITDVFLIFKKDDILQRLLVYTPKDGSDDPLSPTKANIVNSPTQSSALKERIVRSPKTVDLPKVPLNRICMYLGYMNNTRNMLFANQELIVDVYSHIEKHDSIDLRCLWICERVHALLNGEYITGIGKLESTDLRPIANAPEGYIGYRMIFIVGSGKG